MRDESAREHAEVPRHGGAPSPGNALLEGQSPLIGVKKSLKARGRELPCSKHLEICGFELRDAECFCLGTTSFLLSVVSSHRSAAPGGHQPSPC